MRLRILSPLRVRAFALLWAGQSLSQLGDSVFRIALILFVVRLTHSSRALALVTIAFLVPSLALVLIAGLVVDRFPRVPVVLGSDASRGAAIAVLALLASLPHPSLASIVVIYGVFGIADAFFQPAYPALVAEVVPAELLIAANSLNACARQVSLILGPALGAILVAATSPSIAFLLDAATFAVSVLTLFMVGPRPSPRQIGRGAADGALHTMLRDLASGISYVFASSWLAVTILAAAVISSGAAGLTDVGLPFLARTSGPGWERVLGWLYSAQAVGALVAALVIGQFGQVRRMGLVSYAFLISMSLSLVGSGMWPRLEPLVVLSVVYGVSYQAFGVLWSSTLQRRVPGELLGRVVSVDYLGSFLLIPIGTALTGILLGPMSPMSVFILVGLVMCGAAAAGLLSPSVRRLSSSPGNG